MITVADVLALVLLLAIAVYAAGGGTDYGAGFWDLFAGGPARQRTRRLIDHAMAPVWEANNVWLIFAAVITWTAFPILWQSIFASLYPLLAVGVIGLVLRGAGFALRKLTQTARGHRTSSAVFGLASIATPFCFSAALGAIASGRIGLGSPSVPIWLACLNPSSVAFGVVGVAATAFTGAAFLVGDAHRYGAHDLEEAFRRRALWSGIAVVVLGVAGLAVLAVDARPVFDGLTSTRALPFVGLALAATICVAVLLARRVMTFYRVATVIAIGSFVFAWGLAQYPYVLPGVLTIAQAAGARSAQLFFLVVAVVALLIVIPSLGLLYWLDQHNDLEADEEGVAGERAAAERRGKAIPPA